MPSYPRYLNFNKIFGFFPLNIALAVSISTLVFYKICWHSCISTPCERTQHAHDLEWRLFLGLLFLENCDFSQLKKPPFVSNSNSTGKWSLTPSACKTRAQRGWEPATHALSKPCPRGFHLGGGEVDVQRRMWGGAMRALHHFGRMQRFYGQDHVEN